MALNRFLLSVLLGFILLVGVQGVATAQAPELDPADVSADLERLETVELDGEDSWRIADITDEDLRPAFRRVRRDNSVQFDLPTRLPEVKEKPGWRKALDRFFEGLFEFLAPFLKAAFWVGLGAIIMVFLYAIITAIVTAVQENRFGVAGDDRIAPEYRPTATQARILLEEADRLAANGQYAEAIRVLLFRSIQDIERLHPRAIRLSLTSREIAAAEEIGPDTRRTFGDIAQIVERSHFAGEAATEDDYVRARQLYQDFATRAQVQPDSVAAPSARRLRRRRA